MVTEQQVRQALAGVMDPELGRNIVELGMAQDVVIEDGRVSVTLALTTMACPLKQGMADDIVAAIQKLDGNLDVNVIYAEMSAAQKQAIMDAAHKEQPKPASLVNHVEHVIAVMSGKGGVGKSSVAAMLAVALNRKGLRVGVLDADITGPSIPKMFGARTAPGMSPLGIIPPQTGGGIALMSINLLLEDENEAVIWRGPLVSGAIKQFWEDVVWGTLDVLVVDLPPGTSDASLTVMQSLPVSGVVMVTSPQDLAGMVVRKAAQMASRLEIKLLGLIENMSYAVCPDCGKEIAIFGPSHGAAVAKQLGVPLLGRLPIDPDLAAICDEGRIENYHNETFDQIAETVRESLKKA
jgi:Mrp family chromosome partitioning ATPase